MMLRLFRLGILVGLIALASECLNLAQSANQFVQTAIGDWTVPRGR
jgi:hypothetical protein